MPLRVHSQDLATASKQLCDALAKGECVALPTETVYGLAADASNGKAVARIFSLKKRPQFNPLICHVSDQEMAGSLIDLTGPARRLADLFWPGPLTLVMPKKAEADVHDLVSAGLPSLGVRCPIGIGRQIIEDYGKPLAAPSANPSGRLSPTSADHVLDAFSETDLMVLDGGSCVVGIESTIVKVEQDHLVILRPGSITAEELSEAAGLSVSKANSDAPVNAPGMLKSHYAPLKPVVLSGKPLADRAVLAFGPDQTPDLRAGAVSVFNLSDQGDLMEAAANLYAGLKGLDRTSAKAIQVEPIPEIGIGIAINDRLRRAAAPRDEDKSE